MNKEALKELAKEHATVLGSQILSIIGQALINFANQVANPKKTFNLDSAEYLKTTPRSVTVVTPENFTNKAADIN